MNNPTSSNPTLSKKGTTFRTYPTDTSFDLAEPVADMVHAEDLAWHLSQCIRYNGGIPWPYTVAQHSLLVSNAVLWRCLQQGRPAGLPALYALLHDAHEAYTGDIISPFKRLLPGIKDIEHNIQKAVHARFGLADMPADIAAMVDDADKALFAIECQQVRQWSPDRLQTTQPALGEYVERTFPSGSILPDIEQWTLCEARERFGQRLTELLRAVPVCSDGDRPTESFHDFVTESFHDFVNARLPHGAKLVTIIHDECMFEMPPDLSALQRQEVAAATMGALAEWQTTKFSG